MQIRTWKDSKNISTHMWDFIICLEWTFHITGENLTAIQKNKKEFKVKTINQNKFYI